MEKGETKLSETLRLLDKLELALSHATVRKEIGLVESMACMEKLDQVTKCIEQSNNLLNQKAK